MAGTSRPGPAVVRTPFAHHLHINYTPPTHHLHITYTTLHKGGQTNRCSDSTAQSPEISSDKRLRSRTHLMVARGRRQRPERPIDHRSSPGHHSHTICTPPTQHLHNTYTAPTQRCTRAVRRTDVPTRRRRLPKSASRIDDQANRRALVPEPQTPLREGGVLFFTPAHTRWPPANAETPRRPSPGGRGASTRRTTNRPQN